MKKAKKKGEPLTASKFLFYFLLIAGIFILAVSLAAVFIGCGCPRIARHSITDYPVDLATCERTPTGACVVPGPHAVDDELLHQVDDVIAHTEACLSKLLPRYFKRNVDRSCYVIVLAPDARPSCEDADKQLFGHAAPEACLAKGITPKPGCECGWRVAIQDGRYIVVTPNLEMLAAGLAELRTGWRPFELRKDADVAACINYTGK